MIQAVIFDCFGVLTTESWTPFRQKYFGDNPKLMEEASERFRMVDLGMLEYDEFLDFVAEHSGVPKVSIRQELDKNVANEALFDFIQSKLKPTYKIGMLSNAGGDWLDQLFSPEQKNVFDAVSLSFQSGYVKPDHRAYFDIADKLGYQPNECLLVDDQERYCSAAWDAGMQAVEYTSFEQMKVDITKLL